MNPLEDSFEQNLVHRVFLWVELVFVLIFFMSVSIDLLNPLGVSTKPLLLLVRIIALLVNAIVLVWAWKGKFSSASFSYLPLLMLFLNSLVSITTTIVAAIDIISGTGSFLVSGIIFILIYGFFAKSKVSFLAFCGLFLVYGLIAFIFIPELFFSFHDSRDRLELASVIIMFFGLVFISILVFMNNLINSKLLIRARQMNKKLRELAFLDHVSNLPNGLQLESDIEQSDQLYKLEPYKGEKLVLAGFRLDGLETLNEKLGVEKTDLIISAFVEHLVDGLASFGVVQTKMKPGQEMDGKTFRGLYRVEGNVFMWFLPLQSDASDPLRCIPELESLLAEKFSKLMLRWEASMSLGFQGGFSTYPDDAPYMSQQVRNVLNMLHARNPEAQGKFLAFNAERYQEQLRIDELKRDMVEALASEEIHAYFQPKIDILRQEIAGFEALARWISPKHGPVSPAEFIKLAEERGLIAALTKRILQETFRFIELCKERNGQAAHVAVNLSPELLVPDFLDWLEVELAQKNNGPFIELEITEGVLMNVNPTLVAKLRRLQGQGVKFAIDDFGTGYSNLGYIQKFEASVLKIDKRFIDGIPGDEKNAKLVLAILHMAQSFGMLVVAEGVEYLEQRNFLASQGCNQIQGFFYSKPLEMQEALRYISNPSIRP